MVLHLAERLSVPLRERNVILTAAGFAPVYREQPLDAPELDAARAAIEGILQGHEPHPALAIDRHWTLLSANRAVGVLLAGVADHLLAGEVNVLRLSLHPDGLASRILNFGTWRAHILARLAHEIDVSADPRLAAPLDELKSYPAPRQGGKHGAVSPASSEIAVPLMLKSDEGPLSFISTTTIFGMAVDVTLSEVTIEAFFPADPETAKVVAGMMAA